MTGPAPTPTKILEARGSWRAKTRGGEPTPPLGLPACPAWLRGEARKEWRRVVRWLLKAKLAARCDRGSLAVYCDCWRQVIELDAMLATVNASEERELWKTLTVSRFKAMELMCKTAQQFGFTPSSRTRLTTPAEQEKAGPSLRDFKLA